MSPPTEDEARFAREQLVAGCHRMEQLLRGLLNQRGRVAEQVHATRKLGKSLRGGFCLFRLGKSSALEIQAIGRLHSGPRDAVSRLSTWKKIPGTDESSAATAISALLEQQTRSAARRPPAETISWCLERVAVARENLQQLPADDLAERIAAGLHRLEKRVVKRCCKLDHRGHEEFHDARKALKAYLGAYGFLPEGMVRIDPRLAELPELLGDENDLATLSGWLEDHGFTEHFVPALWLQVQERRNRLRAQVIDEISQLWPRDSA